MPNKTALIIGAGPAGLTAALELLKQTGIKPVVLESSEEIGGISKTVVYNGNRMDIGGHRFFSKSDWVMQWWQDILPIESAEEAEPPVETAFRQKVAQDKPAHPPADIDKRMLIRSRLSRIYFLRKFFPYPLKINLQTIRNLGLVQLVRIATSYFFSCLFPRKPERNLEDFIINRFGRELYSFFFKDYTEKVWGVPCSTISPEWGAQRIKGLSIGKAILFAAKKTFALGTDGGVSQKETQTSLIERFLYPKFGPGQMWQEVAERIRNGGGEIHFRCCVTAITLEGGRVGSVAGVNPDTGEAFSFPCDYLFSTMPVRDLIAGMTPAPPREVLRVAHGLLYRDFLTVGLLVKKMKLHGHGQPKSANNLLRDNWIYIQERDVKIGRLQIFNNWSPYLVKDPSTIWLGLEYFCSEGDTLWRMKDDELKRFGAMELARIGLIDAEDVMDGVVVKTPKAYPAYFGTYGEFNVVTNYLEAIENMFLIGRNGMHRYNNQDHSMLTAKLAVDNIVNNIKSKQNIWAVNINDEYHEEKS